MKTFADLTFAEGIVVKPIQGEEFREYVDPKTGSVYRVTNPLALHISESGSHYVVDAEGVTHHIKKDGSFTVRWKAGEGHPNISFSGFKA